MYMYLLIYVFLKKSKKKIIKREQKSHLNNAVLLQTTWLLALLEIHRFHDWHYPRIFRIPRLPVRV